MLEKNDKTVSLYYKNSCTRPAHDSEEHWAGYNLFILFCCLSALGLLAAGDVGQNNPEVRTLLDWADTAVCAIFLIDFFVSLVRSKNKLRYLCTWGWIDLISAIPALDVVRWGRAARILRILRVIRGIKVARIIISLFIHYRTRNALLAGGMVVIFSIFTASTAILVVETEPHSTIKTAEDAVWWTLCTISTVGYGDLFPVTRLGRVVASFLLLLGVGVFGALAGILANWFTGESSEKEDSQMKKLTEEVAQLRSLISERQKEDGTIESTQKKKCAA
ncbi:MAG: ion transporter [Pirellulales bacterium]